MLVIIADTDLSMIGIIEETTIALVMEMLPTNLLSMKANKRKKETTRGTPVVEIHALTTGMKILVDTKIWTTGDGVNSIKILLQDTEAMMEGGMIMLRLATMEDQSF